MRIQLILLLLSAGILGCSTGKNALSSKGATVEIEGTVLVPYCGSDKPSEDVAAGHYESMKLEQFNLVQGITNSSDAIVYKELLLDKSGKITVQLPPGTYQLYAADKMLPLDDFITKNEPLVPQLYVIKDKNCFEQWKNEADFTFTVVNDTVIELRKIARCYTDLNPCIEYIGPKQ